MKRKTRQRKTQARYIRIFFLVYTHCPFRWTVVIVKSSRLSNKGDIFSLEHGVILIELYTKLSSFSSTQGSEIDGCAFEQIQSFKASATPAPITTLILSPFGCVKFTCKTEADV